MTTCRSKDPALVECPLAPASLGVPYVPRASHARSPGASTQRARGAALPIVLLISSMMLVTSAA